MKALFTYAAGDNWDFFKDIPGATNFYPSFIEEIAGRLEAAESFLTGFLIRLQPGDATNYEFYVWKNNSETVFIQMIGVTRVVSVDFSLSAEATMKVIGPELNSVTRDLLMQIAWDVFNYPNGCEQKYYTHRNIDLLAEPSV